MFRRSARLRMVFQFLIVQLKADNGQYFAPPSSIVSIPYSTIKSIEDGKFKVEHILVSIPYSTIKSTASRRTSESASSFQFLIVQLKVACIGRSAVACMFQFLIVQLKALSAPVFLLAAGFQFLIVQLKASFLKINSCWEPTDYPTRIYKITPKNMSTFNNKKIPSHRHVFN